MARNQLLMSVGISGVRMEEKAHTRNSVADTINQLSGFPFAASETSGVAIVRAPEMPKVTETISLESRVS